MTPSAPIIADIAIDSVSVLNPRRHSRRALRQLAESIAKIGLKRPITVAARSQGGFYLVCGRGRLEACRALGARTVAAIIIEATPTECLVLSLVENIVRSERSSRQAIGELVALRERGRSHAEIAAAIGLEPSVVESMLCRKTGDTRRAVDQRKRVAKSRRGDGIPRPPARGHAKATQLVHAASAENDRQKRLFKRAKQAEAHVVSMVHGLEGLVADSALLEILRAESMHHVPRSLLDRFRRRRERE